MTSLYALLPKDEMGRAIPKKKPTEPSLPVAVAVAAAAAGSSPVVIPGTPIQETSQEMIESPWPTPSKWGSFSPPGSPEEKQASSTLRPLEWIPPQTLKHLERQHCLSEDEVQAFILGLVNPPALHRVTKD
jgi:hypothetical protein